MLLTTEIPEAGSKGFIHNGEHFFAVKKYGKIYVYKNACPHIGIALEWIEDQFLDSSRSMIQCANHGALFVIETGRCVAGPCTGQSLVAIDFDIINDAICLRA